MPPDHWMHSTARLLSSSVCVALFWALFQPDSSVFATERKGAAPRPQDYVSYYGHKQVQEGDDFIINCFVSKGTNVSWTKDGWPLRSLSQSGAYTVSQYTQGLQVSRLQVWNAEPYHSGVYSCSERSYASHVLEVSPRSASRPNTSACHNLIPNESLHLDCSLAGTKNVAWYKDGKPLILSDDISADAGTTLEIKHATEKDVGTYGCANSHGEQQAPIANVLRLITPIFIEPFPETVRVHPGEPVQLVCHAHGLPEPRVSWSTGEKDQSSGAVLSIRRAATSDAGAYTCKATHESCEQFVAERPVKLKVFESTIRTNEPYQGNGMTLVPGSESLTLRCDYPYNRDLKIHWFIGNERAPIQLSSKYNIDHNGQFLTIRQPSEKDVSNYTCVAFDSVVNESAVIIVGLGVKIRTKHTKTFVEHSDGYLHCAVEGVPKPIVRWYRNNKEMHIRGSKKFFYKSLSGAFGDTIVLRRLEGKDSAMFTCVADNGHSQDRKVIHVFVKERYKAVFPFIFICLEAALLITFAVKWRKTKLEELQHPPAQTPRADETGQNRPEALLEEKRKNKEDWTIAELHEFLHLVELTEVPWADTEIRERKMKKPETSYLHHEPTRIPAKGASLFSESRAIKEPSDSQQKLEKEATYLDEYKRPEFTRAAGTNEATLKLDVRAIPTESQVIKLEGPGTSPVPVKPVAFSAGDVTFMTQPGLTSPETPSPETFKTGLLGLRAPGARLASTETDLSKAQVRELSATGLTRTEMLEPKHSKSSLAVKILDEPALQRSGGSAPKYQAGGHLKLSKLPPESLLSPGIKSALTNLKEGTEESLEVRHQGEKLLSPQLKVGINKLGGQDEEIALVSKDRTTVQRPSVSLALHKKKEEKMPDFFEAHEKSLEDGKRKKESQSPGSEPFSPNIGPGEFYEIDTKIMSLPHGGRKENFPEPTVLSSTSYQDTNQEWVATMSHIQGQSFELPSQTTPAEEENKIKKLDELTPVASAAIREELLKPSETKPPTNVSSKELLGVSGRDIDLNDKKGGKVTGVFQTQGMTFGMSASDDTEFGPPNEPLRDVALGKIQKNGMPHKQPSKVAKIETSETELKPSPAPKGRADAAGKVVVDQDPFSSAFGETSLIPPGNRSIELRLPPLPQPLGRDAKPASSRFSEENRSNKTLPFVVNAKHSPKPPMNVKYLAGASITTDIEYDKKRPDYKKPSVTYFETRPMKAKRETAASLSPDKAAQRASAVVEDEIKPISPPGKDSLVAEKPQKKLKTVNGASEITAADSARLNLYGKEPSVAKFQIQSKVGSATPELSDKLSKPLFVKIADSKKITAVPEATKEAYSTTHRPRNLSTIFAGATEKVIEDHDVPSTSTKITVVPLPESKAKGRLNQPTSLLQEDTFILPTLTEAEDKLEATVVPDKSSLNSQKTKGLAITTKEIPAAHGEDRPGVTESILDVIEIPSSAKATSFSAAPHQDEVEHFFLVEIDDSEKQMSVRDDACLTLVPVSTAPSDGSGPTTKIFSPAIDFKEDSPIKPAALSNCHHPNNKLKRQGKYEEQSGVPQIQKQPERWSAGVVKYHSNETELSSSSLPFDFNRKQIPPESSYSTPDLPSDTSSEYFKMLPKNIAKEHNQEVKKLAFPDVDVNLATEVSVKSLFKSQGKTLPKEALQDKELKRELSKTAAPGLDSTMTKDYGALKSSAFYVTSSLGEQQFQEAGSLTTDAGTFAPASSTISSYSIPKEQEGPGGTLQIFPATPEPADGKGTVLSETGRQHPGMGSSFLTLHPFEFIVPSDTKLEEKTTPESHMKVHLGGSQERYRWFDPPHGRRRHTEPSSTSTERRTASTGKGAGTLSITEPLDGESSETSTAGLQDAAYVKGSVQSPKQR